MAKLQELPTKSAKKYRLLDPELGNRAVITIEAASIRKAKRYRDLIVRVASRMK